MKLDVGFLTSPWHVGEIFGTEHGESLKKFIQRLWNGERKFLRREISAQIFMGQNLKKRAQMVQRSLVWSNNLSKVNNPFRNVKMILKRQALEGRKARYFQDS